MQNNDVRSCDASDPDPHGVLLLDRARRVVSASSSARELIEDARRQGRPFVAATVAIPAPLAEEFESLMFLWDPERVLASRAERLKRAFGLTAAESAVALELYEGRSARDIADTSGRSVNTIRTLAARVYSKVEVGRQSQLIKRIAECAPTTGMGAVSRGVARLASMDVRAKLVHFEPGETRPFHYHPDGHEVLCVTRGRLMTETGLAALPTAIGEARYVPSGLVHRGANRDLLAPATVLAIQVHDARKAFKVEVEKPATSES